MDVTLYKLLKKGSTSNIIFVYLAVGVFLFAFGSMVFSGQVNGWTELLTLIATMFALGGILYYVYRDNFLGPSYWTKLIEKKPEELVWIKPITTEHRAYYIVKFGESFSIELYTNRGVKTEFSGSQQELYALLTAISQHAPHVHYGYSKKVEKIYKRKKRLFAEALEKEGLYHPLSRHFKEGHSGDVHNEVLIG